MSSAAAEHDADTASVVDALECALAVALACEEGRLVALESGALSAAAAVLQHGSSTVAGSGGGGERPLPDLLQACVLAVRLVTAVLGQGPPGEVLSGGAPDAQAAHALVAAHWERNWGNGYRLRCHTRALPACMLCSGRRKGVPFLLGDPAGQEQEEGVLELVPALASLLALPALLMPPTRQPAGGQQAAQAPSGSGSSIPDLAALQLEALHALHLVLMRTVSEGCYAPLHVALAALARRTPRGGWPARAAAGLSLVLRGRVSPQERHAALQLAALLVELLGPEWLLGEAGGSGGAAGSQMGTAAGSAAIAAAGTGGFYQLLVEIVKVETSVLLLDALAPAAPVPLGGGRAAAPGAAALRGTAVGGGGGSEAEEGASASEGEGADEAAEQLDQMELDELEELSRGVGDEPPAALGGPGQPPPPQRPGAAVDVGVLQDVLASEAQRQKLEERLRAAGPAAAAGGSAAEEEGAAGAAGAAGTGAPGGAAAAEAKGRERVDIVKLVDEMQLPAGGVGRGRGLAGLGSVFNIAGDWRGAARLGRCTQRLPGWHLQTAGALAVPRCIPNPAPCCACSACRIPRVGPVRGGWAACCAPASSLLCPGGGLHRGPGNGCRGERKRMSTTGALGGCCEQGITASTQNCSK